MSLMPSLAFRTCSRLSAAPGPDDDDAGGAEGAQSDTLPSEAAPGCDLAFLLPALLPAHAVWVQP